MKLTDVEAYEPPALRAIVAVHREVGRTVDRVGRGPLAVLPSGGPPFLPRGQLTDTDAMLATTAHGLPLVNGFTGYQPPHRARVHTLLSRLWNEPALAELVEITHVRWILVYPPQWAWGKVAPRARTWLAKSPLLRHHLSSMGFDLYEVLLRPSRSDWFDAIAAGPRADRSVLGTPLEPLPPGSDAAEIELLRIARSVVAGRPVHAILRVTNRGTRTWPSLTEGHPAAGRVAGQVHLRARWRSARRPAPPATTQAIALPRDVRPGESVLVPATVRGPAGMGGQLLEFRIVQHGTRRFRDRRSPPRRITLRAGNHRRAPSRDRHGSDAQPALLRGRRSEHGAERGPAVDART